jgi:S-formylglutathione hydrolase FrmB
LFSELPDWLAANRGLAPGGHAAVGAAQGGYAAMALACFHPERFRYAGSMSGFLYPSNTAESGILTAGMKDFGGADTYAMWGPPQAGRWKWHDPYMHAALLSNSNARVWVYNPTGGASDPAAVIGNPDEASSSGKSFYTQYRFVHGLNGHFDFSDGDNGWASWASQLRAMANDIAGNIK